MTRTLVKNLAAGLYTQGWRVVGRGGTWAGAMRPVEEYVKRKVERAVKAEREACAQICDAKAKRNFNWGSENADKYHAQADWAEHIAVAIRARGENT